MVLRRRLPTGCLASVDLGAGPSSSPAAATSAVDLEDDRTAEGHVVEPGTPAGVDVCGSAHNDVEPGQHVRNGCIGRDRDGFREPGADGDG